MQMIKSSALILWLHLVTYVKCQDCTLQQFVNSNNFDSNFDLSDFGVTYPGGAQVIVPCNVGYTGFFRLICTEGRWTPRGTKCQPQSCGRPGNSQFADFRLEIGDDFVFGSEVVYECYKGYHLVSRTNRRRCLANGWDGNIPICEATKCPDINVDSNVHVLGNAEHATSGSTVWFSCKSSDETLVVSEKIYCEDGVWIGLVPQCRGIQAIKCELTLPPITGTTYNPPYINMFLPGQTLRVTCGEKHWILDTQTTVADVTCQNNGAWETSPLCQEVTCPQYIEEDHLYRPVNAWGRNKLDDTVRYDCDYGYQTASEDRRAKCTRDGWAPKPLCRVPTGCSAPPTLEDGDTKSIIRADSGYQHGERVEYLCQNQYTMDGGPFKICDNGVWKGDIRCLKPCTVNEQLMNEHNIRGENTSWHHADACTV